MPFTVVAVDTSAPWTTSEVRVAYDGRTLILRPGSKTVYPTLVLEYAPDTREAQADAIAFIRRFLSALAWTERSPIRIEMTGGGGFPVAFGRGEPGVVTVMGKWRADYLPEPADDRARLALALYREALVLERVSVAYAFLGFFKILNIGFAVGKAQITWTNAAIPKIREHRAVERLAELTGTEPDVGEYLYGSGRCAVAHAFGQPTVNPDDMTDTLRLAHDLPVVQALAEHFIETELGVKSYSTILSEHLYELDAFRTILGDELVARLKAGDAPEPPAAPQFPPLTVRLDGREDGVEFKGLVVTAMTTAKGTALLVCSSPDERLQALVELDFARERLRFDPVAGTRVTDDGTVEAVDHALMVVRFLRGKVLNGRTEVLNAHTGERLGRTDAFIPLNIDFNRTMENLDARILRLEAVRKQRIEGPAEQPANPPLPPTDGTAGDR